MKNRKLKFVDLFAGVGGISFGYSYLTGSPINITTLSVKKNV